MISTDDIYNLHEYNINPNTNELFIFGEESYTYTRQDNDSEEPGVEYTMANKFIRNLKILEQESDETITIHMKTCGGMWTEGMAIYDAIKTSKNYIKIINYSHARSMSSLILLAADEKIMHKHSTFMFHSGTMAHSGTVKQFRTEATEMEKGMEQMLTIYIDAMKQNGSMKKKTRSQIKKWLISEMDHKEDVYLSAEQAVSYGFADKII